MPTPLILLCGLAFIGFAIHGLLTGSIIGGSRGLHALRHSREESPWAFFAFVLVYLLAGLFLLLQLW